MALSDTHAQHDALGPVAALKLDLMFEGVRYSEALGNAAAHSFPNFYPYRFQKGEPDPTGKGKVEIPYLMSTADGTLVRVKGSGDSPWVVAGSLDEGYALKHNDGREVAIEFEPLPKWMQSNCSDGFPMVHAGLGLHGDMAVVNVAPGCEYFLEKRNKVSMRCTF